MSSRKKAQVTTGKRKTSKARVVVSEGKGRIRVNNTPIHLYKPDLAREKVMESLWLAGRPWTPSILRSRFTAGAT